MKENMDRFNAYVTDYGHDGLGYGLTDDCLLCDGGMFSYTVSGSQDQCAWLKAELRTLLAQVAHDTDSDAGTEASSSEGDSVSSSNSPTTGFCFSAPLSRSSLSSAGSKPGKKKPQKKSMKSKKKS